MYNKMSASNESTDESEQLTLNVEDLSINDVDDTDTVTACANCGKEVINPNTCNKCKAASYCNAACKKKHRSKHETDCAKRVAKLQEEQLEHERRAAELHDRELFKQPPQKEDCPICMLPIPSIRTGSKWKSCCGKVICSGCIHTVRIRDGAGLCPFCRTPTQTTDEEQIKRAEKRVEMKDVNAMYTLSCDYYHGQYGKPQDHGKALELWHRAAELGHAMSSYNIGGAYYHGNGVERDMKKANHYYELAAMGGDVDARYNLGALEKRAGNMKRALRHYMIAAGFGDNDSLEKIKQMFMNGDATKDDYTKALRSYQANLVEIKSAQRDEAAAANEDYKYY